MLPQLLWPESVSSITFILEGSFCLMLYVVQTPYDYIISWLAAWMLVGVIISVFSKSKYNSVRTAMWTGVSFFILLLAGVFIQDPTFWQSTERNFFLLVWFIRSTLTSMLSLVSAIPLLVLKEKMVSEKEKVPPEKIETICTCGATYKSNPLICAECGKSLRPVSALPSDSATK